jgi:hypothetical protein
MTNSGTSETPGQHVLTKTLRDGETVLAIYIEPHESHPEGLSFWLVTYLDGKLQSKSLTKARPLAKPQGDITHGWQIHTTAGDQTYGMTAAEARQIETAQEAWLAERQARIEQQRASRVAKVRAAAPDAPTSVYSGPDPMCPAGATVRLEDGSYVTGLAVSREYIRDDGWSLGVHAERGYLYHSTVRAATEDEIAALKSGRA